MVKQTEETAAHECAVCKDMYSVGEEARRMPCEHVFHTACLTTWLKQVSAATTLCVCRSSTPELDLLLLVCLSSTTPALSAAMSSRPTTRSTSGTGLRGSSSSSRVGRGWLRQKSSTLDSFMD